MYKKHVVETKVLQLTYYSKQKIACPVCDAGILREELLSGSGRLVAGELTDELRRTYTPSAKYGTVYPLIYPITVCPKCHLALFTNDFDSIEGTFAETLTLSSESRAKEVSRIFPNFDFTRNRTLLEGAASYYLALLCYEELPAVKFSTSIKRAILSLRLAWVCGDLHKACPERNFDFIQSVFYKKALFFYGEAMRKESNGEERISNIASFGPDLDKNYGFDGVTYLYCLLEYKYGQRIDTEQRLKHIDENKRALARMFGLGKSSKSKPGPMLEHARDLYDKLTAELKAADALTEDDEEE